MLGLRQNQVCNIFVNHSFRLWHLRGSKLTAGVFFLYNSLSRYNTTKYVSLRGYNTDKYCVTTNHQSSTARFFLLIFVKEIETYGKRNRHLLVLYVFFVLINAWTTVMHYFFHFAIYNDGLKSVLLYIRYLLLTVLSKADCILFSFHLIFKTPVVMTGVF